MSFTMTDPQAARGERPPRLGLEFRLSLGALLHAAVLLAGSVWALSEVKAELATEIATLGTELVALQKDLDGFKGDMRDDVAELRGEIAAKQDRPFLRVPARP
jgi:outer membrane murein-binding lipoprotein Lpp